MSSLRLTILSAGKVGGTLGRKWARTGHSIAFRQSHLSGGAGGPVLLWACWRGKGHRRAAHSHLRRAMLEDKEER